MSTEQPTAADSVPAAAPAPVDPAPANPTTETPSAPVAAPATDTPATTTANEEASKENKLPKTQRSWRITGKGEPAKVLKLASDTPVPAKLKKGEVLVKVQAAALNPVGYKTMGLVPGLILRRVQAAEYDLTGVVVDGNNTVLKEGDQVFGWIPVPVSLSTGQGALQQYARVPAIGLALRPPNVTPTQAAGFGIAGLTAYQALEGVAHIKEGQSVFVNGGSTAVGAFAIQLAKARGAKRVGASASAKNEEFVRRQGADEFFDYTKSPLHEQLAAANPTPKYDVFLEAVGLLDPTLFLKSEAYLDPHGVFISVGPQGSGIGNYAHFVWTVLLKPGFLGGVRRKWKLVSVKPVEKDLKEFAKLVEEGKIKPLVDSVYEFEDVLEAYEKVMSKRATGKIVVKVDPAAE
ncbi:NAD-P-binding protein [Trametes coccinea BRFM310]|uniref:NAD-P-binding protein n=1 Tax=Trametes coccinea (strain BRFM310) TaxID=1353009 RepID=A0A1Y2IT67_TRAC3|nr:NAD-P-binding protein [Trametes coccinea BRFM310]